MYKPGHQNVVADALSTQQINTTTSFSEHSANSSPVEQFKRVKQHVNSRNEMIPIHDGKKDEITSQTILSNRMRHLIYNKNKEELISCLKVVIRPE